MGSYLNLIAKIEASNSRPRYSVRTTMPSLVHFLKVSQVFKLQDRYNASSNFICLGESFLSSNAKIRKNV